MLDWAVAQSPVHVALLGTDLRHLRLNTAMCQVLGLPDEAAGLGLRLTDLQPDAEAEAFLTCGRQVIETGEPGIWRGFQPSDAGPVRAWEATVSPVKDQAGQVIGVLVVSMDVTEQYLARERLALLNEASTRIGSTLDVTTDRRGARRRRRAPAGRPRHDRHPGLGAARRRAGVRPGQRHGPAAPGGLRLGPGRARPRRWPGRGRSAPSPRAPRWTAAWPPAGR